MTWLRRFVRRNQLEIELDHELRYHFEREVEQKMRGGMSREEARRSTTLEFGGIEQIKELCRDARGTRWIDDLVHDLRFAWRLLLKNRGFTAVAIIALGLGIGVNNTFFIVVNAVCLRGLPIDQADRVMFLSTRDTREHDQGMSHRDLQDTRAATRALQGLAGFVSAPMVIGDEGRAPDRVSGAYISGNAFELLHESAQLGRTFRSADDRPGAPAVVILGNGVWKTRYGADPSQVGRSIRVNGVPAVVIGVMPDGFRFPNNADLWQPLLQMPGLTTQRRDVRILGVFGRLKDDATRVRATAELNSIAERLSREFPETNRSIRTVVVPINERYSGKITDPVWLAFITAGVIVLFVACANVANLLLTRAVQRSREIAIRASIGATRRRVVRQLLAESGMLATLGGIAGLGFSLLGARLLSITLTDDAPYWIRFTMDGRGFFVLAGVCLSTVIIFGLAPALYVSKTDLNELLQEGSRGAAGGPRARRWTTAFLTAEFALTMILVAAAAVGFRNFQALQRADLVVNPSHLLTMWISLPAQKYPTAEQRAAFFQRLTDRLREIPAISSLTIATALPFGGATVQALSIDGQPPVPGQPPPTVSTLAIGSAYFATLGVSVLEGRDFVDTDGRPGHETAIVNQRFAAMHFPGQDPVGRRIRLMTPNTPATSQWVTIVGISPTIRQRPQGIEPDPVVYLPLRAAPPVTTAVMMRNLSDTGALAPLLREELRVLDPDLPVYRVMTMEQVISESKLNGRVSQALITIIACIALLLAAVGLYAVTAHAVAQRTQEIGIRMALGARSPQVMTLVLKQAARQLGLGLIMGVLGTVAWQWLFGDSSQRYRMTDPIGLVIVAVLIIAVGLVACLWPVRRATSLDPVLALRCE